MGVGLRYVCVCGGGRSVRGVCAVMHTEGVGSRYQGSLCSAYLRNITACLSSPQSWEMNDAASKVAHDNLHGRRHFDQRESSDWPKSVM